MQPVDGERADTSIPPHWWMQEHHAYQGLMLALMRDGHGASTSSTTTACTTCRSRWPTSVPVPMVTTLHTPPTPWLRVRARARVAAGRVRRGQPVHRRRLGRDGRQPGDPQRRGHAALGAGTGRRAGGVERPARPREGAPPGHRRRPPGRGAAAARRPGPRHGVRRARGPAPAGATTCATSATSTSAALCALVGRASVAVVTPDWEEPYGLVAAEAMACGTPVAALDRGAMREVVVEGGGVLARPARPGRAGGRDGRPRPGSTGTGAADRRATTARSSAWSTPTSVVYAADPRATAGGRVIGYYVHHHGHGHLHRAIVLADACRLPVVGLSSLPRPTEWTGEWVQLARDDDDPGPATLRRGQLHWAPLDDEGLRCRMATLSAWIAEHRPAVLVSDVSVEVAMLARLHGVPVVSVVLPGDRGDAPHRAGLGLSSELVSFWPPSARGMVRGLAPADAARLRCLGALSRFGPDELAGGAARRRRTPRGRAQRLGRRRSERRRARTRPGHVARLGVAGARGAHGDVGGRPDGGAARRRRGRHPRGPERAGGGGGRPPAGGRRAAGPAARRAAHHRGRAGAGRVAGGRARAVARRRLGRAPGPRRGAGRGAVGRPGATGGPSHRVVGVVHAVAGTGAVS